MDNNYLQHYGVLGMRWGVRRARPKSSSGSRFSRKSYKNSKELKKKSVEPKKKTIKDLSDNELRSKINRLELEKRYKELSGSDKQSSRGKKFVMDVLETSGKSSAIRFTTFVMNKGADKILSELFGETPKK